MRYPTASAFHFTKPVSEQSEKNLEKLEKERQKNPFLTSVEIPFISIVTLTKVNT